MIESIFSFKDGEEGGKNDFCAILITICTEYNLKS